MHRILRYNHGRVVGVRACLLLLLVIAYCLTPTRASCTNGIKDTYEYGVDCGGACTAACDAESLRIRDNYGTDAVLEDGRAITVGSSESSCPGSWSRSGSYIHQRSNCYTSWSGIVTDTQNRCHSCGAGTVYLMQRLGSLGDFVAEFTLRSDDNDEFGVVWSHSGGAGTAASSLYQISYSYGSRCIYLVRREDTTNTYLQKTANSDTFRYPIRTYFSVRLTYIQGYIKFEIRHSGSTYITALEYTDPSPLGAGNIGFSSCSYQDNYYRIDSLRLLDNTCDRLLPKSSSSLKIHLTSESFMQSNINEAIGRWRDISGYGNHAWTASSSQYPNVVRSRWTGQKVVSFIGSDMLSMHGAYYLDPRATGMSLYMVMDPKQETGSILEGPPRRPGGPRIHTEDFSGIPSGSGYVNSNSLRNENLFRSRFTLARDGARMSSNDWAQVKNGLFETRDTNGWLLLTLVDVNIAGSQDVVVRYSLHRYGGHESSDCVEAWASFNGGSSYSRQHRHCGDGGWAQYSYNVPPTATRVRVRFRMTQTSGAEIHQLDNIYIEGQPKSVSVGFSSSAVLSAGIGVSPALQASRTVASSTLASSDKPILVSVRVTPFNSDRNSRLRLSMDGVQFYDGNRAGFTDGSSFMYHVSNLFDGGQEGLLYEMQVHDRGLSDNDHREVEYSLLTKYRISSSTTTCPSLSGDGSAWGYSGSTRVTSSQCITGRTAQQCSFGCNSGTAPVRGQQTRTCTNFGFWGGVPLACAQSCPKLSAARSVGCERSYINESFRSGTATRGGGSDRLVALPWRGSTTGWSASIQQWRVNGGYLSLHRGDSCSTLQRADNYLVTMDQGWESKSLPLDVSADVYGDTGSAGFVIRTQFDTNDPYNKAMADHYLVVIDWSDRRIRVQRRAAGELRGPICNTQLASSVIKADTWLNLRVRAEGNRFQVYLDGTRRCDVQDASADALPSGGAGLYMDTPGAPARFRDLQIKQIDAICEDGCDEMAAGEMCTFACRAPFVARGDSTRTCYSNGGWDGTAFSCGYKLPTVSNYAREILEESPENTAVGDPLVAAAPDGLTVEFEIASGNTGDAFSVSSCTGQLRVATPSAIDYESGTRSFTLTMRAMTEGDTSAAATLTVTVSVLDRNEPPEFAAYSRSIDENAAPGTNVGAALTATDPEGDDIVWSIELGNANNAFQISPSGQLTSGITTPSPLDFEQTPTWRIVVRAANTEERDGSDVVVAYTEATITVTLNDVNEPPIANNMTVDILETFGREGQSSTDRYVGSLSIGDYDMGQTVTVSAGLGYQSSQFNVFANGSVRLKPGVALDYETRPVVLVPFIASDDHSPSASAQGFVIIQLEDVNESPVVSWPGESGVPALSVPEDAGAGDEVGRIVATDPDRGQQARFRIDSQSPAGKLLINTETGVIALAGTPSGSTGPLLDTETQPTLGVNITVYDTEFYVRRELTITVANIDEPPVFTTAKQGALAVYENSVSASAAARTSVGTIRATDPESGTGSGVSYSIVSQDVTRAGHTAPFVLDSTTGLLQVNDAEQSGKKPDLDHEFYGGYMAINISASDGSAPAGATVMEFLVTIRNVNEAPSLDASSGNFFAAASRAGTIGRPLATFVADEDLQSSTFTERFNFSITAGDSDGIFSVQQGTGQLFVTAINAGKPGFAFSSTGGVGSNQFSLSVQVTDKKGLSGTGTVLVQLTETNIAPSFSAAAFTITVDENAADATLVGRIDASDANDGQTVSFSLAPTGASANVPFPFVVYSATGGDVSSGADGTAMIKVASGSGGAGSGLLDYEGGTTRFEAVLTATDSHSTTPLSSSTTIVINVNEVAEAPYFDTARRIPSSARFDVTIEEGAAEGTAVRLADAAEEAAPGQGALAVLMAREDDVADNGTVRYTIRAPTDALPSSYSTRACGTALTILGDGAVGALAVGQAGVLDFELSPSFRCTIVATDGRGASDTADVFIALIDSNDHPSVPADQVLAVAEDAAASAAVGTVSISDPDSRAEWRSFEVLLAGDPSLSVARDNRSSSGLDDENDDDDDDGSSTVSTGGPQNGTGNSSAPDPHVVEDATVYELFEMDRSSGSLRLRAGQQLDWEMRASYEVRVIVTDGGGLRTDASVTVRVQDVDDAFISGFRYVEDTDAAIGPDGTVMGEGIGGEDGGFMQPGTGDNATAGGSSVGAEGGSVQYGTVGGDWVVLQGSGFSPVQARVDAESLDLSMYQLTASYGPASDPTRYTASECRIEQAGFEVACRVVEGVGAGHVWMLRLLDSANLRDHLASSAESSATTSYSAPSITSVAGVGGIGNILSTRGATDDTVSIVVEGTDFGPVGTMVQLNYGPSLADRAFSARDCRVTNAHVQITCHPVAGVGGPLDFVATVGGQMSVGFGSLVSYETPAVTSIMVGADDSSFVGLDSLPTAGGPIISLIGSGFGPALTQSHPIVLAGLNVKATFGGTNSTRFMAVGCKVVRDHDMVNCTLPEGLGRMHSWIVYAGGLQSTPTSGALRTSYAVPRVTSVGGPGAVAGSTRGGLELLVSGTDFGPTGWSTEDYADLGPHGDSSWMAGGVSIMPSVTYGGPNSARFMAASCRVSLAHSQIACVTSVGTGANHTVRAAVGGQMSESTMPAASETSEDDGGPMGEIEVTTVSYAAPVVALYDGDGAVDASTPGGDVVVIKGEHFGPVGKAFLDEVRYGLEERDVDLEEMNRRGLEFDATASCNVTVAHEEITCAKQPGAGAGLKWRVIVDGLESRQPTTAYAAPSVSAVIDPATGDSNGPVVTDAWTDGGQVFELTGENFGPPMAQTPFGRVYLDSVRYGASGQEYDARNCTVLSHERIRCRTAAGVGRGHVFRVTVRGQSSALNPAATLSYAPPVLTNVQPTNGPTKGLVAVTVDGTNLGLQDSRIRSGDAGDESGSSSQSSLRLLFGFPDGTTGHVDSTRAVVLQSAGTTTPPAHRVTFLLPEGEGSDLGVQALVDPGQGPSSWLRSNVVVFDYDSPALTRLHAELFDPIDRPTDYRITATGTNFGPSPVFVVGEAPPQVGFDPPTCPTTSQGVLLLACWEVAAHSECKIVSGHEQVNCIVSNVERGCVWVQDGTGRETAGVLFESVSPSIAERGDGEVRPDLATRGGTVITMRGTAWSTTAGVMSVDVDGSPCTNVSVRCVDAAPCTAASTYELTCTAPAGQGAGIDVTVLRGGVASLPDFDWNYAAPSVSSVSPSLLPTSGGLTTITGMNFGAVPGDAGVVVNGVNVDVVSWDHEEVVLDVREGQGSARNAFLDNGRLSDSFQIGYMAPFVASAALVGGGELDVPSRGMVNVTLAGSNFGVQAPAVHLVWNPSVPRALPAPLDGDGNPLPTPDEPVVPKPMVCEAVDWTHRSVTCTVPAGQGAGWGWRVTAGGQSNDAAAVEAAFSYNAPRVLGFSSHQNDGMSLTGGSRDLAVPLYPTEGGVVVNLSCADCGTAGAMVRLLPNNQEGPAGSRRVQAESSPAWFGAVVPVLSYGHDQISFVLPEGQGDGLMIDVVVMGQRSSGTVVFEYDAPYIAAVAMPAKVPTRGTFSESIAPADRAIMSVLGHSFGIAALARTEVRLLPPRDNGAMEVTPDEFFASPPLQATDEMGRPRGVPTARIPLSLRPDVAEPSGYALDTSGARFHSHSEIPAGVPQGYGRDLRLVVAVDGRLSNPVPLSYDAPEIFFASPNQPSAAGDIVRIFGNNLGETPPLPGDGFLVGIGGLNCTNGGGSWTLDSSVIPPEPFLECETMEDRAGRKNISVKVALQEITYNDELSLRLSAECDNDYYGDNGEWCLECPVGADCPGGPVDPVSLAGFFDMRPNISAADPNKRDELACPEERRGKESQELRSYCFHFLPCQPQDACLGNNECSAAYTGPRCAECSEGHFRSTLGVCEECPDNQWVILILFVVAVLFMGIGAYFVARADIQIAPLSLSLDYAQVLAILARSKVPWPPIVLNTFRILSAFNLNIDIVAPQCIVPNVGYIAQWTAIMLLPLAALAMFGLCHVSLYLYKLLVLGRPRSKRCNHYPILLMMGSGSLYILYLQLTRTILDVWNCSPTTPPDGKLYLQVVFEECGKPGGVYMTLLPFAIIAFAVYTVAYPVTVAVLLYRSRDLIVEDQLLRARGLGKDRSTNPHAFDTRKSLHKLYYFFRPVVAPYWILTILARKFGVAVVSLLFVNNAAYQLATLLLVVFLSYTAQVYVMPYMSREDMADAIRDHEQRCEKGDLMHITIKTRLQRVFQDRAKAWDRRRFGYGISGSASDNSLMASVTAAATQCAVSYNTLESTYLALTVLIALSGVCFYSGRFDDDLIGVQSSRAIERDVLTVVTMMLIFGGLIFCAVSIGLEVYTSLNEQWRKDALNSAGARSSRVGKGKAGPMSQRAMKELQRLRDLETGGSSADSGSIAGGLEVSSSGSAASASGVGVNPMFLGSGSSKGADTGAKADEALLATDVPDAATWQFVRNHMRELKAEVYRLRKSERVVEMGGGTSDFVARGTVGRRVRGVGRPGSLGRSRNAFGPTQADSSEVHLKARKAKELNRRKDVRSFLRSDGTSGSQRSLLSGGKSDLTRVENPVAADLVGSDTT